MKLLTEEGIKGAKRALYACARLKILISPKRLQIAQKGLYTERYAQKSA